MKIEIKKQEVRGFIFSILIFISCVFTGNAQNDNLSGEDFTTNPNLRLGVKAGLGFSNIQSAELTNKSVRPGMAVGVYLNYKMARQWNIQVELDGNLRGANFNFDQASSLQRLSLFYFDVPVTLQFIHSKEATFIPFLGIQPSLIFRKDAYKTQEFVPQPIALDIKKYDLAASGGFLIRINANLDFQVLMNYGILNINKNLTLPFYPYLANKSPMFNRNLQLCLVF